MFDSASIFSVKSLFTLLILYYNICPPCVLQNRVLDALSVSVEESLNGGTNMAANASDNKKRKMRSHSYGDDMIKSMSQLRENNELCDFTVSSDGYSFKVVCNVECMQPNLNDIDFGKLSSH